MVSKVYHVRLVGFSFSTSQTVYWTSAYPGFVRVKRRLEIFATLPKWDASPSQVINPKVFLSEKCASKAVLVPIYICLVPMLTLLRFAPKSGKQGAWYLTVR